MERSSQKVACICDRFLLVITQSWLGVGVRVNNLVYILQNTAVHIRSYGPMKPKGQQCTSKTKPYILQTSDAPWCLVQAYQHCVCVRNIWINYSEALNSFLFCNCANCSPFGLPVLLIWVTTFLRSSFPPVFTTGTWVAMTMRPWVVLMVSESLELPQTVVSFLH